MGKDGNGLDVNLGDSVHAAAINLEVLEKSQGLTCVIYLILEECVGL